MNDLSHYVKIYDDVFEKDFCDTLIKRFDTLTSDSSPTLRMSDHDWNKDYRRFLEVNIKQDPAFQDLLNVYYSRILKVHNHYKQSVGSEFFPSNFSLEDARMKKYRNDDSDQFGWHVDVGDKPSSSRYLAMFTYLNTVDEGGETQFFSNVDFTIKPMCGRIVVFPPMWMFTHRGKKPISSSKYILSTYLHYV